ncbi:MAG: amidohydrolase family protein, partial [Acidiferrobacterales bacterium]
GVDGAVLVQPSFLGTDNQYLVEALGTYRNRFRGVAVVSPTITEAELDAMATAGVVGIRLNFMYGKLPDLTAQRYQELFMRTAEHGWHIQIHLDGPRWLSVLPPLLNSGAVLVFDHFGRPDPRQGVHCPGWHALLEAGRSGHHWVKLSAPYRLGGLDPHTLTNALLDAFGPDRLVWASDFPWTQFEQGQRYAEHLKNLDLWINDPDVRAQVLGLNPATLYGF